MTDAPAKLVIRRHNPRRSALLWAAGALVGGALLLASYDRGRHDAGYDREAAARQRSALQAQAAQLEQSNQTLRTRVAELETRGLGQVQERADLARTIGELQAQVARQSQELEFFRGVVTPGEATIAVRIQQVRITAGTGAGHFRLRLTLVQTAHAEHAVSGALALKVDGRLAGQVDSLDLPALTGGRESEEKFSFRYFQTLDDEIELPANYRPERLSAEITAGDKAPPLTQSFPWRLDAS